MSRYPSFQHFSKPFDSWKSGTWQGKEIRGIIRTVPVNYAPLLVCSKDDRKTVAETATDEMVMGAVRALCEFSLLVSQHNHSDLSLNALAHALKQFYEKKGIFRKQKMSRSVTAKVDDLLATESHQLCEERIHIIHAVMEALVYGAEMVSTTKRSQFQVRLNRAQQVATTWSDADRQKAIEQSKCKILQVTPGEWKLVDKLF